MKQSEEPKQGNHSRDFMQDEKGKDMREWRVD